MRLPSPTTEVFPSGFAISHNISKPTEGKQNTKPKQQQHKRIDYLDALIMGMFQDKDGNSIDLYDNRDDLEVTDEARDEVTDEVTDEATEEATEEAMDEATDEARDEAMDEARDKAKCIYAIWRSWWY